MPPLLKRIVVNGLLTATILGVLGFGLAELAGTWLVAHSQPAGPVPVALPDGQAVGSILKFRIPATMAICGFLFVAGGELILHAWRNRRGARLGRSQSRELKPDTAEVLLEELLRQIESQEPKPAPVEAAPILPPTPSLLTADNNPAPLNQRPA
jgi:hypothetical protein